jgi:hypothetical protein
MMPWNIRLALWITNILCPRIGAKKDSRGISADTAEAFGISPDFVPDLEPDTFLDIDNDYWADYAARCESTRRFLDRCLSK